MAVMISKQDLLQAYLKVCEDNAQKPNIALQNYLMEQATQQQVEQEQADNEMFQGGEGNSLDFIFRGNDKQNFASKVSDNDLLPLVLVLEPHSHLIEYIDLRYNLLTDSGAATLGRLLKGAINLRTLYLQSNSIGIEGAISLTEALREHEKLVYLNLNGNSIGTRGTIKIVELLFSCPSIVELDLGNNYIDHDGIIAITTVLNRARLALEVLNVENPMLNSVMQETAVHFGKMLSINQTLQKLSLRKFRFRCDGIYTLANHLMENSTLKVLDLSCNQISAEGAEYLSRYLRTEFCALESLILANNQVVDLGAKALAQGIADNQSLIHIDLTNNSIEDEGLSRLAEALFHNQKLLSFKLFGNHFNQQSLKLFHRLFNTPRDNEWYPDFRTYYVDEEVQMAYVYTEVPYSINV